MANLFIIKGSIRNMVEEELFNRIYKPNGWVIDETRQPMPKGIEEELKTETELKNYKTMKKKSDKVFNDNLIKKGE
jgi:hypothetical protein